MPLAIVSSDYEEVRRVHFLDRFHRGHELGEILNSQPSAIDTANRCFYDDRSLGHTYLDSILWHSTRSAPALEVGSLGGVGARVFVFQKCAAPSVGEVKVRHVEHQHGLVPRHPSSKDRAQHVPEIVFVLFDFHYEKLASDPARHHAAVAGFCCASFEGETKVTM